MFLFWLFMLLMVLLIPLTMILFGLRFRKKPPHNINTIFGYRTAMSTKNRETWDFAHRVCGRLWLRLGLILVPVSVIPLLAVMDCSSDTVGALGTCITLLQLIPLLASIIPVERALKAEFDEYGKRRAQ